MNEAWGGGGGGGIKLHDVVYDMTGYAIIATRYGGGGSCDDDFPSIEHRVICGSLQASGVFSQKILPE